MVIAPFANIGLWLQRLLPEGGDKPGEINTKLPSPIDRFLRNFSNHESRLLSDWPWPGLGDDLTGSHLGEHISVIVKV
jgi:hypothetical protein